MRQLLGFVFAITLLASASTMLASCNDGDSVDSTTDDIAVEQRGEMGHGKIDGCSGQIAYQRWMWQGEAEATFVFLSGRTEYTDKYHRLVELVDRPWNIIMFDHFGQGRSDGPRAHADDFEAQHVCDLGKIIEALAPAGVPIVIGSHSMGGFVATRFAELHPGLAVAYVFGSPMYRVPFPYSEETVRNLAELGVADGNGTVPAETPSKRADCASNSVTHDCEFYDQFRNDPITEIGPPTWGWVAAYFETRDNLLASVGSITEPVLMFQAGEETVVVPEAQNELCDMINADNPGLCRLEVFEDDRHEIFNELDREVAVAKMLTFFDDALAAD